MAIQMHQGNTVLHPLQRRPGETSAGVSQSSTVPKRSNLGRYPALSAVQSTPAPVVHFSGRSAAASPPKPEKGVLAQIWDAITFPFRALFQAISDFFLWLAGGQRPPESTSPRSSKDDSETSARPRSGSASTITTSDPKDRARIQELEKQVQTLETQLTQEKAQFKQFQTILAAIPHDQLAVFDVQRNERLQKIKTALSNSLGYDWRPAPPPKAKDNRYFTSTIDLPLQKTLSTKRAQYGIFRPPVFTPRQSYNFSIPTHESVNPVMNPNAKIDNSKADIRKFLAERERATNILRNYGENSVNWPPEKIARDLLQNFYDGHGHTLEGVKFSIQFSPATQRYTIRIAGQAQYNHQEIEDFGAGKKSEDPFNAGGYGEGSKVLTVRLLAKYNVPKLTYQSADWKLSFKLGDKQGEDKDRVYKTLEQVSQTPGNYVEFETENEDLVKAVLNASNYFYHPENPDFQSPTFENKDWGFKYVGPQGKGNIYLANQRFEALKETAWHNELPQLTLYAKRKPAKKDTVDYGRDRTSLNIEDIEKILKNDLVKTMTKEQMVQALMDLREFWSPDEIKRTLGNNVDVNKQPAVVLVKALLSQLDSSFVQVNFPSSQRFISLPQYNERVSEEILADLSRSGYILCHPEFYEVGMRSVMDIINEQRNHKPLQPTSVQIQKFQLLRQAAQILLEDNVLFSKEIQNLPLLRREDIQQPLYIFDRFAEPDMKSVMAEAIIDKKPSDSKWHAPKEFKGAWFDKTYLDSGSFEELLSTYLHEMSHQYGGDESMEFSYIVTDWMTQLNNSLARNGATRQKLHDLMSVWDQLPRTPRPAKSSS